ncbi:uncharacterized protein [Heptranchias perlo]|uniref:uncharacterized protein isoform X2 n=1 Tax=Heptranchias perlo TaxID=212740 RepID=UPI003559784F
MSTCNYLTINWSQAGSETGVYSNNLHVQQTPLSVALVEGQNVTINCTIDFVGPKVYEWLKFDIHISKIISMYSERVNVIQRDAKNKQILKLSLRIKDLTECDSGTYYCVLDVMDRKTKGQGTIVTVMRASQTGKTCSSISIRFIGVAAGVIALLCISLIIVSVRLVQRNKACIALQRQFVAFITEKSTESVPSNQKGMHKRSEGNASSSHQQGKKKRKPKQRNKMDNAEYVHFGQPQATLP